MRTCHAKLGYFDWDGQVHLAKGKTGGQQGNPLEMLIFNFNYSPFMGTCSRKVSGGPGGCLPMFQARAVTDVSGGPGDCLPIDGYTKGKLSVALQVLAELKRVLCTQRRCRPAA